MEKIYNYIVSVPHQHIYTIRQYHGSKSKNLLLATGVSKRNFYRGKSKLTFFFYNNFFFTQFKQLSKLFFKFKFNSFKIEG